MNSTQVESMKKLVLYLFIFVIIVTSTAYCEGWDVFNLFGSEDNKKLDTKELYKESVSSVVALTVMNSKGGMTGTGFFALEPDIIATCYHVVAGATSITAKDSSGNEYKIEGIIDYSEKLDIAILKSSKQSKTLTLDANMPSPGTNVYSLGNPMGLNFSFTNGMVSQIQNLGGTNVIQFTAPVSPGNSGGPLLSENGKVLGIVSAYFTKGQNLNFAVPVAMLYILNKNKAPKFDDKIKKLYDLFMKDMVKCPAGSFMMGSPENDEIGSLFFEIQHKVTISKPFYIGKYEVIQRLYEDIIGNNPSEFKGETNPVENVNWYEAKEFCEKLNMLFKNYMPKGYKFDLPSEAQWEYACRAGTTTGLNNGKNLTAPLFEVCLCPNLDEVGWYNQNSNDKPHPVGQKKPNAWGIYDMHGNVYEWCRDKHEKYPTTEVRDPIGSNIRNDFMVRGGCCLCFDWSCRSASRSASTASNRNPTEKNIIISQKIIGFRVALVPID